MQLFFFNILTNTIHNDTHSGNFLYYKIKEGRYFHYSLYDKDYYLENNGYLWNLSDFGNVKYVPKNLYVNVDFYYIVATTSDWDIKKNNRKI